MANRGGRWHCGVFQWKWKCLAGIGTEISFRHYVGTAQAHPGSPRIAARIAMAEWDVVPIRVEGIRLPSAELRVP